MCSLRRKYPRKEYEKRSYKNWDEAEARTKAETAKREAKKLAKK